MAARHEQAWHSRGPLPVGRCRPQRDGAQAACNLQGAAGELSEHVARWQPALAAGSPAQPAFAMGVRSARDSKRPNAATSSSSELSSSSGGVTKRVLPMHTAPVRRAPPPETSVACAVRSPCAVMGCDAGHASMSCCISESRPQEGTTNPGRWALVSCSELREHSCCVACLDTASKYESLLRSAA